MNAPTLEHFSVAYPVSFCTRRLVSLRGRLHRFAMETCSARIDPYTVFTIAPRTISPKNAPDDRFTVSTAIFAQTHSRQTGVTLIIVLFLIAILQLLAVATLNRVTLQIRMAANTSDGIQAFHAADAGVLLCARRFEQEGNIPVRDWPGREEPFYWRTSEAFEGPAPAAFEIAPSWPHSARPPQCLVEIWSPSPPEENVMALITVRGFGATTHAHAWQQLIIEPGRPKARHDWRSVAARPY